MSTATVTIARSLSRYPSVHIVAGEATLCGLSRDRLSTPQQIREGEIDDLAELCSRCVRAHAKQQRASVIL